MVKRLNKKPKVHKKPKAIKEESKVSNSSEEFSDEIKKREIQLAYMQQSERIKDAQNLMSKTPKSTEETIDLKAPVDADDAFSKRS